MERKAIARWDRKSDTVSLFFPEEPGDFAPNTMGCFDFASGHGAASLEYYRECKPCPDEIADEMIGKYNSLYEDNAVRRVRIPPAMNNKRYNKCRSYNSRARSEGDWGLTVHLLNGGATC